MRVLVVNAGSSSVKVSLLDARSGSGDGGSWDTVRTETLDPGRPDLDAVLRGGHVDAVGHRVVHGGERFRDPVVVDDAVLAAVEALGDLAPLHQGPSVAALRHARTALPHVPHVACFDTAFHATLPPAASTYAIPARWRELGVRRYGFHGLAHEGAAERAAALIGRAPTELRVVVAHLGSGASACAVDRGRSVDTTMGFTPTAGLVMGTRSGDLDPAVPLWLVRAHGLGADEVADALDHDSGLLGLGGHADMRRVLTAAADGDSDARLALDVWTHRLRGAIASMAAAMGGVDVLVFSGGVGEHRAELRADVVAGLGFLGLAIDPDANAAVNPAADGDADVSALPGGSTSATAGRVVVVHAREDVTIARHVRDALRRR